MIGWFFIFRLRRASFDRKRSDLILRAYDSAYASINSSGAHLPRATAGAFGHVVIPGLAWGPGISIPRGEPRAFDMFVTRVFERWIYREGCGFVKDWLVRQGLEKPVDVFKGMFSQF